MPTYLYNGTATFVSSDYNIRVDPGESVETPYVLPSYWPDFTLTNATTPPVNSPIPNSVVSQIQLISPGKPADEAIVDFAKGQLFTTFTIDGALVDEAIVFKQKNSDNTWQPIIIEGTAQELLITNTIVNINGTMKIKIEKPITANNVGVIWQI